MAKKDYLFGKGNQLWKRVDPAKIGRPTVWETPADMWRSACEYFDAIDNSHFIKYIKGNGDSKVTVMTTEGRFETKDNVMEIPTTDMYTIEGFCIFNSTSTSYLRVFKHTAQSAKKSEFLTTIALIEEIILAQQKSLAAAGLINPAFIAAMQGLRMRIEQTNINFNSEPLSTERIREISKALDDEC